MAWLKNHHSKRGFGLDRLIVDKSFAENTVPRTALHFKFHFLNAGYQNVDKITKMSTFMIPFYITDPDLQPT
jgi:hypothetical protein